MTLFILTAVLVALFLVDWSQTRFIAKNPALFYETNFILGKHPTVRKVNIYFGGWVAAVVVLAFSLPEPYALAAGALATALEAFITVRNQKRGVRFA